jgi:hypothetical protein
LLFIGANSFTKYLFLKGFSAKPHIFVLLAPNSAVLQHSIIS